MKGQSLLEWLIFSSSITILWMCTFHLATRLTEKVVAETWSIFVARQKVSFMKALVPAHTTVQTRTNLKRSSALIIHGRSSAQYQIQIPQSSVAHSLSQW